MLPPFLSNCLALFLFHSSSQSLPGKPARIRLQHRNHPRIRHNHGAKIRGRFARHAHRLRLGLAQDKQDRQDFKDEARKKHPAYPAHLVENCILRKPNVILIVTKLSAMRIPASKFISNSKPETNELNAKPPRAPEEKSAPCRVLRAGGSLITDRGSGQGAKRQGRKKTTDLSISFQTCTES